MSQSRLTVKQAPIDFFSIAPTVARANGVGVAKNSPHPYAAVLFYDVMLSDAQLILQKRDYVSTNKKIDANLSKMALKFIDPKLILDEEKKWTRRMRTMSSR